MTRDDLVDAALGLIDERGVEAVTMRALAARLGVTPMALYHHVADRDALLRAVLDRVTEDADFPEPAVDPAERAEQAALTLHGFFVAQPWAIRLITSGRHASSLGLWFPEQLLSAALDLGASEEEAFLSYRAILAAVIGQAQLRREPEADVPTGPRVRRRAPGGARAIPEPPAPVLEATPLVARLAPEWARLDAFAEDRAVLLRTVRALLGTLPQAP